MPENFGEFDRGYSQGFRNGRENGLTAGARKGWNEAINAAMLEVEKAGGGPIVDDVAALLRPEDASGAGDIVPSG